MQTNETLNSIVQNPTPIQAPPISADHIVEDNYVMHRRFDRMGRLIGDEKMKALFNSHVMVIGLGGVGSWAAESLARSGVGKMTIVDHDEICITNANRQLHALQGLVGKKKAEIMGERLQKINPQAKIQPLVEFYNAETSEMILAHKPDLIVDCIDNMTAKCHLLAACRTLGIPVITSGGSAAKLDPTQIRVADLGETYADPMAAQVRKILRQKHDFPEGKKFGITCVFSPEEPNQPVELKYDNGQGFKCVCPQGKDNPHGCDQRNVIWGNASFVTGAFGLVMASRVVKHIISGESL